jgi:hypothetical protein
MKTTYPVVRLIEDRKAERHYYLREDGVVIPGVSEIKTSMGLQDLSKIPVSILLNARNRGIAVHDVCEQWELGTLKENKVHPDVKPYLEAFKQFYADKKPKLVLSEYVVYSKKHNYAGKLDRVYLIDKNNDVLDIKATSTIDKVYGLQVGFYKVAAEEQEELENLGRQILQLKKDGTYELFNCDDPKVKKKLYDPFWKEKVINLADRYNERVKSGNIDNFHKELYSF